jgi:hypothetical protein
MVGVNPEEKTLMTDPFPKLKVAVAECRARMHEYGEADRECSGERDRLERHGADPKNMHKDRSWRERNLKARDAAHAHQEALKLAYGLIAEEVLPAVAGGEWMAAPRGFAILCGQRAIPRSDYYLVLNHHLFDHHRFFRRRGERGPLTFRIGIVTGEPYGFKSCRDLDGNLGFSPLTTFAVLAERGLDAIGHHHLSPWCPGGTALLIVGRNLDLDEASRLGFTICAHGTAQS